jgi:hypothetical protein
LARLRTDAARIGAVRPFNSSTEDQTMTVATATGWDAVDNHQVKGVSETALIELVTNALAGCALRCKEKAILQMCSIAASEQFKVRISKGLHQDDGNSMVVEKHVTLDEPDYPNPKRFHLYFMFFGEKRGPGKWLPTRITHVTYGNEGKALSSFSL